MRTFNYRIEAALVILGFGYLGFKSFRDRDYQPWHLFFGWTILYFIAYTVLGVSRYFWYYAPLIPGIIGWIGLGAAGIVLLAMLLQRFILNRLSLDNREHFYRAVASSLTLALIIFLAAFQVRDLLRLRNNADERISVYRTIGEWLQENTSPDSTVGTLEVGIIGYYSQRQMVDYAGLLMPDVAAQLSTDKYYDDAALWASEKYRPDYIVLHEGTLTTLNENYIIPNCNLVRRFNGQQFGFSNNMLIYKCNQ